MRKRLFNAAILALLVASLVAPAVLADSHGSLMGIQWQWTGATGTEDPGDVKVPIPEDFVLVLNEDGSASIKADCNLVQWTYTLEGDALTFNTLGPSTLAFCGDESLDQVFLALMGMGGTVAVKGEAMTLTLNEEAGTMTFQNGGAAESGAESGAETLPETGGALVAAPWMTAVLAGLAAVGVGTALRRKD
jgi:heat shock protein HslJ